MKSGAVYKDEAQPALVKTLSAIQQPVVPENAPEGTVPAL
jgi:hypothetical protein